MNPSRDHEAFETETKASIDALIARARPLVGDDESREELDTLLDRIDELLERQISNAGRETGIRDSHVRFVQERAYAVAAGRADGGHR